MNKHSQTSQQLLIPQKQLYPQVYRWKIATIVILVLITIFLVVDVIMIVYLVNHAPRKNNYSFIRPLLDSLPQKQPFEPTINIFTALSKSYPEIWYQKVKRIFEWKEGINSPLDLNSVGSMFKNDNQQLLSFIQIIDSQNQNYLLGAYTHIGFSIPEDSWAGYLLANSSNSYFTFEIEDRQSALFGGADTSFLKMDGSSDDLVNCQMIRMTSQKLTYLDAVSIDYSKNTTTGAQLPKLSKQQSLCFVGMPLPEAFKTQLYKMGGLQNATEPFTLKWLYVHHLSE